MSKKPTVSVIIPAYNAEQSLSQCIDSTLAQTHRPLEVFVIDDGSTDNTKNIATSYGDPVIFLEQTNQGQGAARNMGLAKAQGDYITFLDADDYWLDEFLETCIKFLEDHHDAVAVNTGQITKMVDGKEQIGPVILQGKEPIKQSIVLDDFFDFWAKHDHIRTGSALIRRATVEAAGYQRPDLRVSQDLEYWGYIATFGKWAFIPVPLWVGNSRAAAVKSGWLKKYKQRRKLCPTVESWEERLKPRVKNNEIAGFNQVRGRVAAGYAQNMILSGRTIEARHIVSKYGPGMPKNRLTIILLGSIKLGAPGWWLACQAVKSRELLKAIRFRLLRVLAK